MILYRATNPTVAEIDESERRTQAQISEPLRDNRMRRLISRLDRYAAEPSDFRKEVCSGLPDEHASYVSVKAEHLGIRRVTQELVQTMKEKNK